MARVRQAFDLSALLLFQVESAVVAEEPQTGITYRPASGWIAHDSYVPSSEGNTGDRVPEPIGNVFLFRTVRPLSKLKPGGIGQGANASIWMLLNPSTCLNAGIFFGFATSTPTRRHVVKNWRQKLLSTIAAGVCRWPLPTQRLQTRMRAFFLEKEITLESRYGRQQAEENSQLSLQSRSFYLWLSFPGTRGTGWKLR